MNRENTNRLRYVLEELLPPALRDSWLFRFTARHAWSAHIDKFARFRERAPFLSADEYATLYREYPRIHEHSDLSEACAVRIERDVTGHSVLDVGCGTGALLRRIRSKSEGVQRFAGIDVQLTEVPADGITYYEGLIEKLPFVDGEFDTVVCTHVLEHVLDYRAAIAELRRVAAKKLIIVVPREREYRYTFNPHFHFFPYVHSFVRAMHPLPDQWECEDMSRDIYYWEKRS